MGYPRFDWEVRPALISASEQFGGERGHLTALARGEGDVAEAVLATESADQYGEGVVRLSEIGRIDLARVAGEEIGRAHV